MIPWLLIGMTSATTVLMSISRTAVVAFTPARTVEAVRP